MNETILSSAPEAPRTHWALGIRDLPAPRTVREGDGLTVRVSLAAVDGMERTLVDLV